MQYRSVKIGNYFSDAPYGFAIIVDDETGFLIDPDERKQKDTHFLDFVFDGCPCSLTEATAPLRPLRSLAAVES